MREVQGGLMERAQMGLLKQGNDEILLKIFA